MVPEPEKHEVIVSNAGLCSITDQDVERVGIGGNYRNQQETPEFGRREYLPVWPAVGKSVPQAAQEEAPDILGGHRPPELRPAALDEKNSCGGCIKRIRVE